MKSFLLMMILTEGGNTNGMENHSGKDQGSIKDVNMASVTTAGTTHNLMPGSKPSD